MPYLKKKDRPAVKVSGKPGKAGELNYILTKIVLWWLGKEPNYERYNAAVGALECAKIELYRRMIAPYEDKKKEENGDVF